MYNLGTVYDSEAYKWKDKEKAVEWFRRAAEVEGAKEAVELRA